MHGGFSASWIWYPSAGQPHGGLWNSSEDGKSPPERVPVILENRVAAELLGLLSHSFLSENVQKGKSRLSGKIDSVIMSPLIHVVDNGLYPGGPATAPGRR